MEVKENDKYKTWRSSPDSESSWTTVADASSGRKFTIPKIRKTTEKVYLSSCYTNTREYGFIHNSLKQCRLDVSCDLQFTWQFGDTKLVRNEFLEKQFSVKRSEMRENGRHGRESEEHFCFLALPQSDAVEIYQNGLSTKASTLKILGNPLLGIYMFRHVDVALNYAHSRSTTVETIMIFKVLFGKVKKIQPSMDQSKVSLDPSPNFDCHMSRNMPSLKDTIELQAYNSMVYFYEYDFFSRPVDRPRQCLPYAVVTVKFIGQKAGNGQLMTSLRFPSTGFPKRLERACSLNNCTVAKRIGKGKDATVIFEHFRKPVDPFGQENCPCNALTSEMGSSSLESSSSYGSVPNGNNSVFEAYSRQTNNSSEVRDSSQVHTHNSGLSFMPTANTASDNGDLFSVTYLRSILSSVSAVLPSQSSTDSSTVITSKLIKDPRLMKREQSMRKQNNTAGLSDGLSFDKSVGHGNSEIKLTCTATSSVSSPETALADHTLTNCSDTSSFKFSSERPCCQTQNMGSRDCDCTASRKIAVTEQCKEQSTFSFPCYLPNSFLDVGKQKYNEEEAQKKSSNSSLSEQSNLPQNNFELEKNSCNSKDYQSHISMASWSSDLNSICKDGHKMSAVFPVQKKGNIDEYEQNTGIMTTFISPEDSSKHVVNQTLWKGTVNYFTDKTTSSPVDITLHQERKECGNLNSLREYCKKIPVPHKLQMPKIAMSTKEDKNENNAAVGLECDLTPDIDCLLQKHPQYSLEHKDNVAQELTELKAVQNNQNIINKTDAFQEAKDVTLANEQLIDRVISSSAIDVSLDSPGCNIIAECMYIQRENKNEAVSLYNLQEDCKETSHFKDDKQEHYLWYDADLSSDPNLKINLQEQRDFENPNEAKEKDSVSSLEYNTEKQDFHANIVEMKEIESNNKVEILNSEECSTFNSTCEKKGLPVKFTLSESENSMASIKQRHTPSDRKSVDHLVPTFPEIEASVVCVASSATKQVINTTVLTLNTHCEDHQNHQLKETCASEISDLGLRKHGIFDCEIDTDKEKLQDFSQLVNETSGLQTFELGSEIEVQLEDCNNASLLPQNIDSQANVLCEEFELYNSLKSRIDWEGIFVNTNEEMETSSFAGRESTDPHSTECNCVSLFAQKDKRELHNPVFLPDLQVTITNLINLRISPIDDYIESKDNFYKRVTESTEPEANEEGKAFGFSIYSQTSEENLGFSCENKCGNSVQESVHLSKSGISHSSNSVHNTHVNHMSGKPNTNTFPTEPCNVAVTNVKSKCPTKSKPDINDTRNKKDMESRSGKRNLHASSRGQNISHKDLRHRETHEKRRKTMSHDSSECFSSVSQGRIKTFSQSERHIRNVLNILNNEASLCKSKHLSRKLDKAVLHLKKAHRRVHTSLQLISKVGKKRKGPLPKAYSVICNNFWESCDLQGDSWMSERRSTRHFLSKRRYDKQGEKRLLRLDIDESLTSVSKHRSYRTKRARITECLSSRIMSGRVSRSLTTFHVREFCGGEQVHKSQLPLPNTSQSISQSEDTDSIVRNACSSELEYFSETSGHTIYPDETRSEKEYQTDAQIPNSDSTKCGNHSTYNIEDITKENNSEDKTVVCESNLLSLSSMKENISHSQDKGHDLTFKANTDNIVLDSDKHFLNVSICEHDNLVSDGTTNGETILPIEKCTVLREITPSIPTVNVPPLSPIPVTAGVEESVVGNGLVHVKGNEVNITKHSKLDLMSVTGESKSCKKSTKLSSSDTSLLLKENVKGPSKIYMAKYIEEEKLRKVEHGVYQKTIAEGSAIVTGYKRQNKILKEGSFHSHKKIIKNSLTDSCLGINNSTQEKIALKNIPSQLSKRQKAGQIKQQSDCPSKPATAGTSHRQVINENSEVTAPQKKAPTHMQGLIEEHGILNYTSRITELSHILQRADKAVSLQVLEEETKVCQNLLPLFVKAFERKQECSLDQILISRKLMVEQNLWDNCRLKLKPSAVDTWVELQMAMETIQFIENKKRFLEGEATFRSLLWYDESLYSELLPRPHGYQLQSNFYPAFQRRLKYNAFCELQSYYHQLVEILTETKKENNSYYAFLKYKRQIKECEAIMRHYSDCFDFCLSVPFTCAVNFGDTLGELEALRKSILKLISMHAGTPKVQSYPGKKDQLWIILEVVSSKISFIKSNEEISIKICLYGLEHIYFDAAKSLVWKEKSHSYRKRHSEKNREMEVINECAFSKWEKIYDAMSKDLHNESAPSIGLEKDMIASRQSALVSLPNCELNKACISYPDICCISEILDQAKSADLETLQDLTLRCTVHLEILKKYFQMMQEENIDNIFITEENILDILNHNHGAVILKPEAVESYIETVMLSETIHFLKNSIAKKLNNQRFRGMLWFDWSLLPELVGCQKEMASFSFDYNQTDCLWKVIETAISHLRKELCVLCDYSEAVNCSYALCLFSRELKELLEIKKLLNTSKYSLSTYIDLAPYTACVNYGNTVEELEHNYNQLFTLLKNIMSVPQKDFGKMVHIIKVLKTIEHMKMIRAKGTAKLSTHLLFFQMLRNRRNTLQLKRKEKMDTYTTEPEENSSQPHISVQTPSTAGCTTKNIASSSKKRPVTTDICEVSQGKGNTDAVSNCKKQKVTMKDVRNRQNTISKNPRTIESHPKDENKIGSSSSDNLKDFASPEMVNRQSSTPGLLSPSENIEYICTPKSESKIELTDSSSDASEYLTEQQESLNDRIKRNVNFNAAQTNDKKDHPLVTCDQKDIATTCSPDNTPAQKLLEIPADHTQLCPSNIRPGNDAPLRPNASVPASHSVRAIHSNLEMNNTGFEHEDKEILDMSIKDCACTSSPEPVCIQDRIPVLKVDKTQPIEEAPNPSTSLFGSYGTSALDVTQRAGHTVFEQGGRNTKVMTQKVDTSYNTPPQPTFTAGYNSSGHSFGTSYPYYAWCFYQYSSSNGTAVTRTYQGMTTYGTSPPHPMMTAVANAVQNTHFNHSYSEYLSYFGRQPQTSAFIPGNGYSPYPMPVSYIYQQPVYSQFASHQLVPQATYPYPSNPHVLPQAPWTYAPWQQYPFLPRH
ncbi:testis-expressed protein 15 [Phodopus roborovskii]|uniref:testis-expressed protein 15 n=1 Tax=Phodopus roborovskii TaxID=109678 RepID=UPI0021E4CC38|nr:testis-expressed protein 15 [Phodopus roborovskii]XP_051038208.1 testis-expressed protein 15 [Phodopus roborovskii]